MTALSPAPDPSPAEQAVIDRSGIFGTEDFARWVVSLDDDDPDSPGRIARRTVTLNEIVTRATAALRGDRAPLAGQHTTDEETDRG